MPNDYGLLRKELAPTGINSNSICLHLELNRGVGAGQNGWPRWLRESKSEEEGSAPPECQHHGRRLI